jgi:hypothetical protein
MVSVLSMGRFKNLMLAPPCFNFWFHKYFILTIFYKHLQNFFKTLLEKIVVTLTPVSDPSIVSYNVGAIKIYNSATSQVRSENFFYLEKPL